MRYDVLPSAILFGMGLLITWLLAWGVRRIWGSCGAQIISDYNRALTWPIVAAISLAIILISYVHESVKRGSLAISDGMCLVYLIRFVILLLVALLYDLMSRGVGASGFGRFVGVVTGAEIGRTLFMP